MLALTHRLIAALPLVLAAKRVCFYGLAAPKRCSPADYENDRQINPQAFADGEAAAHSTFKFLPISTDLVL